MWNALRVFCVALGLVSQYVPAAICATVVLLMACALVNLHLEILPFHSPVENMVRGGIYACVAWTALARLVQGPIHRRPPWRFAPRLPGPLHHTILQAMISYRGCLFRLTMHRLLR